MDYYKERTVSAKVPIDIEKVLTNGTEIINASASIECGLATKIISPSDLIISSDDVQWCVPPQ